MRNLKPSAYPVLAAVLTVLLGIAAMEAVSDPALRLPGTEAMAPAPRPDAHGTDAAASAPAERADTAARWAALRRAPWRPCLAIGLLVTAVLLALVPLPRRRRRAGARRAAPPATRGGRSIAWRAPSPPCRFDPALIPEAANDCDPPHAPPSPGRLIPVMAIGDRPGRAADASPRAPRPPEAPDTATPGTATPGAGAADTGAADTAQPDAAHLATDLAAALARDEFTVHYQPVVNLASGAVTGMEALLRWHHPRHGIIAPGVFIPIAEAHGLIGRVGEWVLRRACADAATWPGSIRLAVNLSAAQFREPSLVRTIGAALAEAGLSPDRLELEITEAALLDDASATLDTLHALRAMGVRIAMDDAGTARSGLRHLRRFPFDRIKLDRAFVRDIADRPQGEIVQAVSGLGTSLGMAITAEGVETDEQLEALRRDGCQEVQGYLFSRPVPLTRVGTVLARLSRREEFRSTQVT